VTLNKFQRYKRLSIFMTGLQNQTRDFRAAVEADNLEKYLIGITIGVVLLSFIPSMGSAGEGNGEGGSPNPKNRERAIDSQACSRS
jgi:hypothetical protein